MDKRYQVFVSSTFTDLKDERAEIIQTLMEIDCIPAGMELFPALDMEQFEFIKKVIDDCDYYLLIISGRYGSLSPEGISYTELEYDYAVKTHKKVIALIHQAPETIPVEKVDIDPSIRKQLENFREKAMTGRLVRNWKDSNELVGLVTKSLVHTIKRYPQVGWVRGGKHAPQEMQDQINKLTKTNLDLKEKLLKLKPNQPKTESISSDNESYIVTFERNLFHL